METKIMATSGKLKVGDVFNREEISHIFGASTQKYLPHVGGDVVCGCFSPEINPNAPEEILVGYGVDRVRYAKRFVEQNKSLPIFLKRASNKWEFVGHFRAKKYSEDPSEVASKAKAANLEGEVAGMLYLEPAKESSS